MTTLAYQFIQHETHLEQVVDKLVGLPPRQRRPVTGWIPQKIASNRGLLALWSDEGARRYLRSGLLGWQVAALQGEIEVRELILEKEAVYSDQHQFLVHPGTTRESQILELGSFIKKVTQQVVRHRAVAYLTPREEQRGELILVSDSTDNKVEIPSIHFDLEEPHRSGVASYCRNQCAYEGASPTKIGVRYDYDFATKEFLATHYYRCLVDRLVPSSRRNFREEAELEYRWCSVGEARQQVAPFLSAKLRELKNAPSPR